MSKKTIQIVRKKIKVIKGVKQSEAAKDMADMSTMYLGSEGLMGTDLAVTGLTEQEKVLIMPKIVKVSANHNEFDDKVNTYFHDLRIDIPAGKRGLVLDISTSKKKVTYEGQEVDFDFPNNPVHYVLYKRAIDSNYKQCVNSAELADIAGDVVKYYIFDEELERSKERELGDLRDKAYVAFVQTKNKDEKIIDSILTVYGINPRAVASIDKTTRLRMLAEAQAHTDPADKIAAYNKFIKITEDTTIGDRAFLKNLIDIKAILLVNGSYIYSNGPASIPIGKTEEEAVTWLQMESNSGDRLVLEATLNK